eukprot:symbB.v1.2.002725.t1/scaffold146.1/size298692/6
MVSNMERWQSLKASGLPALFALPALVWFALCCTTLQALCLLLLAAGFAKEYTEATRFLISVLHRPFLYLMQYSNSRVYVYSAKGDVKAEVLKTIGFDQSLIFSNHRGDLDWLIGLMVEDNGCCKAIVKRELIFLPMFGFSWWAADFICINRNWQADRRRLDAGFKRQHDYSRWAWDLREIFEIAIPYTLTIFPEGTRLTESKLRDSQEYCKSKGLPQLSHSLCPRAKGLWSAINGMQLENVYDITVVEGPESRKANVLTLAQGTAAEFHVFIEKISPDDIPRDEEKFTSWINERWQVKDARIARFQQSHEFVDAAGSPAQRQLLSVDPRCAQTTYGAVLWWMLSGLFFFVYCVMHGYFRLLLGTALGTLLLVALIGVVIHKVHFTHSAQGKKAK